MTAPIASGWSNFAGWDSHPLENAALARRTPTVAVWHKLLNGKKVKLPFLSRVMAGSQATRNGHAGFLLKLQERTDGRRPTDR